MTPFDPEKVGAPQRLAVWAARPEEWDQTATEHPVWIGARSRVAAAGAEPIDGSRVAGRSVSWNAEESPIMCSPPMAPSLPHTAGNERVMTTVSDRRTQV